MSQGDRLTAQKSAICKWLLDSIEKFRKGTLSSTGILFYHQPSGEFLKYRPQQQEGLNSNSVSFTLTANR